MSAALIYRYDIATRGNTGGWVDTDVAQTLEEALAIAHSALSAGQSVMIEPIRSYAVAKEQPHPYMPKAA